MLDSGSQIESVGVCRNATKIEPLTLYGEDVLLCIYRKEPLAYPPGHPALPERYRQTGQADLIPADMDSGSYVMVDKKMLIRKPLPAPVTARAGSLAAPNQ